MKYAFMIFVLISISFFTLPSVNAEDKPNLIKTTDSISIISSIPPTKYPQFELELTNIGNGTGIVTNTLTSNFILKEEKNFSLLDHEIGKFYITEKTIPKKIEHGQDSEKFVWKMNKFKWDEGTYAGKIIINGTNFDPISVDASITYVVSPWLIFYLNLMGIGLAILLGTRLQNIERNSIEIGKYEECFLTLTQLKKLICEINVLKDETSKNKWAKLLVIANHRLKDIEKNTMDFSLKKDSDNMKWFLKTHQSLLNNCCENTSTSNTTIVVPEIKEWLKKAVDVQSQKDTLDGKDVIRSNIKRDLVSRDTNKNKKIFLIVTTIFSSITSIFVLDSVTGPFWMNVLVAIGLGFGVYRVQDFQKWFKKDSK